MPRVISPLGSGETASFGQEMVGRIIDVAEILTDWL